MARLHISEIPKPAQTALFLATTPLEDDHYHHAIQVAALIAVLRGHADSLYVTSTTSTVRFQNYAVTMTEPVPVIDLVDGQTGEIVDSGKLEFYPENNVFWFEGKQTWCFEPSDLEFGHMCVYFNADPLWVATYLSGGEDDNSE